DFQASLTGSGQTLNSLRGLKLLRLSEHDYSDAVLALWSCYKNLRLSVSDATIVVNSKAFYHLLPDLIPPIDRQHTVRFFRQLPEDWRYPNGKLKGMALSIGLEAQFSLFHTICVRINRLADQVDPALFDAELRDNGVTPPKAIDNAIVNYV